MRNHHLFYCSNNFALLKKSVNIKLLTNYSFLQLNKCLTHSYNTIITSRYTINDFSDKSKLFLIFKSNPIRLNCLTIPNKNFSGTSSPNENCKKIENNLVSKADCPEISNDIKAPHQSISEESLINSKQENASRSFNSSELEPSTNSNPNNDHNTEVSPTDASANTHKKGFSKSKIFIIVLTTPIAGYILYRFYDSDFSPSKTEWLITNDLKNTFYPTSATPVELSSKFKLCLDPETSKGIAQYFITLDIDKSNGVRRSDVIEFIEQLGFDKGSDSVKEFVERGKGRNKEQKTFSGCSIQECGDLIEELIIKEELSKLPNEDEKNVFYGFDFKNFRRKSSILKAKMNFVKQQVSQEISPTEERVKSKLKELNANSVAQFTPTIFPSHLYEKQVALLEESPADDLELKRLELSRLEKVESHLSTLQERRGLSEAEQTRYLDVMENISKLKKQMLDIEMKSFN